MFLTVRGEFWTFLTLQGSYWTFLTLRSTLKRLIPQKLSVSVKILLQLNYLKIQFYLMGWRVSALAVIMKEKYFRPRKMTKSIRGKLKSLKHNFFLLLECLKNRLNFNNYLGEFAILPFFAELFQLYHHVRKRVNSSIIIVKKT